MIDKDVPGRRPAGSPDSTTRSGIEREFAERTALDSALQTQAAMWRDEVAMRVNSYRTRRSKKTLAGDFSMKFEFERPEAKPAPPPPAAAAEAAQVSSAYGSANLGHPCANLGNEPVPNPGYHYGANLGYQEGIDPAYPRDDKPGARTVLDPPMVAASAASPQANASAGVRPTTPAAPASAATSRALVQTEQALRVDEYLAEPVQAQQRFAPDVTPASMPIREEREAKVIEFPRALMYPDEAAQVAPDSNELAESLLDKPRILDVPETVSVTAPPLADLALDEDSEDAPVRRSEFDLPLRIAPLPHRFSAGVLDLVIVTAATAAFTAIVMLGARGIPHTKPILGLAAAMPVVFWTIYHYLFLTYSACTPGMQMAGLRISTFQGGRAPWRLRRWRALMMVLSGASLGFGFLWALFDEDCLGWHDRMTSTYVTLDQEKGIR